MLAPSACQQLATSMIYFFLINSSLTVNPFLVSLWFCAFLTQATCLSAPSLEQNRVVELGLQATPPQLGGIGVCEREESGIEILLVVEAVVGDLQGWQ